VPYARAAQEDQPLPWGFFHTLIHGVRGVSGGVSLLVEECLKESNDWKVHLLTI
jgi:hypothetical protein